MKIYAKISFWLKSTTLAWKISYLPRIVIYQFFKLIFRYNFIDYIFKEYIFNSLNKTNNQSLLLSTGKHESFLLSSKDECISKYIYLNKDKPFDFDKIELAFKTLNLNPPLEYLIDIGANIGSISIPSISRNLFLSSIAIEPDPFNYRLLYLNILLNNLENKFIIKNIALGSDDNTTLKFELSKNNYGDHRVRLLESSGNEIYDEANREVIEVKSSSLDNLTKNLKINSGLIIMDTQGYEGHILAGATTLLSKGFPLITEFWPYGLDRATGFDKFKASLLNGKYSHFIDLSLPNERVLISSKSIDDLYKKYSGMNGSTDIIIY